MTADSDSLQPPNDGERPAWWSLKRYADALGRTRNAVRIDIKKHPGRWNGYIRREAGAGGMQYLIDVAAVAPGLLNRAAENAAREIDAADVPSLTEQGRRTAMHKQQVLDGFEAYMQKHCPGERSRVRAYRRFAASKAGKACRAPKRYATMRGWQRTAGQEGLAGLADRRGRKPETPHDRILDYFLTLWLLPSQPKVKTVYRHVTALAESEALACPGLRWWQRRIAAHELVPYATAVLLREGRRAYEAKACPPIQQDNKNVPANDQWIVDTHPLDAHVLDRKGQPGRPSIVTMMDLGSRMIVGAAVTFRPNADVLAGVFADAVAEHGAPLIVKWDNGKDMTSRRLHGETPSERRARLRFLKAHPERRLIELSQEHLGIIGSLVKRNIFAKPYNAKAKAVERWFSTLETQFNKFVPTYCGSTPADKPEHLAELVRAGRCPTLAEYSAELLDWVHNVYHTQPHAGLGGLSPLEAMQQRRSGPKRIVGEATLALLRDLCPVPRTVGKQGVQISGIYYGGFDGTLRAMMGRQVLVAVPRDNAERANIFSLKKQWLCSVKADKLHAPNVCSDDVREANREQARIVRTEKTWRGMSVKRGLRVAEIAQLQAIERGKVRAEQLRKAAGAEQITHVLTGWENAAEDMAAAERQADLRTALGVAEPAPSDADRPDAELIDPEDYADETAGLLRDGGEDFEPDDSDEVYRSLVSDD